MEKKEQPEQHKPTDREKLADKVLDIFSDSPEDMAALIETLKKLDKNPLVHPQKAEPDKKEDSDKGSEEDEPDKKEK